MDSLYAQVRFLQKEGTNNITFLPAYMNNDRLLRLLLGVEDTVDVTVEHRLTNLLFSLLFSSFICPFVLYCLTSTMSSTPSKSRYFPINESAAIFSPTGILRTHQLPNGLIAQLLEHYTSIAEVMGSNPVQA